MKNILVIIFIMSIILLTGCNKNENIKVNNSVEYTNNQQEIKDDNINEVLEKENNFSGDTNGQQEIKDDNKDEAPEIKLDLAVASKYLELINRNLAENQEMNKDDESAEFKYDLIYFNNDDIPDLLVTRWCVSYVYTVENGELKTIVGGYGYGTWGRSPSYASKMGLIKDQTYDMNGFTYEEYYRVSEVFDFGNLQAYTICRNAYTEEITTTGKLDIELPDAEEFEGMIGIKSAMEIKAEILGKSVKEIEEESNNALIIGNKKYKEARGFYTGGGLTYENEIVPVGNYEGYRITNIDEVKEFFTDNKFDKYVRRIKDDSSNFNAIVEENGQFYRLNADCGGSQFYIKTVLMPNVIDEMKMSFDAITYEVDSDKYDRIKQEEWVLLDNNPDEFLKEYYDLYVNTVNDRFTLINDNGVWKVDEFVIPF